MKKIVALFLVFLLLFSFAFAEIDISSLSDEDLLALKEDVEEEISERGLIESLILYPGEYLVGRDIEAGGYLMESGSKSEKEDASDYVYLLIYGEDYYYNPKFRDANDLLFRTYIGSYFDPITNKDSYTQPTYRYLDEDETICVSGGYLKLTKQ